MTRNDLARLWLAQAAKDEAVPGAWQDDPGIAEEISGFHAQQAVENLLKAVLVRWAVPFRRTPDIAELCDLLRDAGLVPPTSVDEASDLTPFGVEFRYADLSADEEPLDRRGTRERVEAVRRWVGGLIPSS